MFQWRISKSSLARQQIVCEHLRICNKNLKYYLRVFPSKKMIPRKKLKHVISNISLNLWILDLYLSGFPRQAYD
jgi:hypothetical protein